MGSAGIGIVSPIGIDPTPEEIGVFSIDPIPEEIGVFIKRRVEAVAKILSGLALS